MDMHTRSEYTHIITYYKKTARVIILKSTQSKSFRMIMKSLYGLCNSKLQQIYAFIFYDFPGLSLLLNYRNTHRPRKGHRSSELFIWTRRLGSLEL